MRFTLLLFHLCVAALAAAFLRAGVAGLPIWSHEAGAPITAAEFDRARFDLERAERALREALSTQEGTEAHQIAQEALRLANASLARRPMNPYAWQARALAWESLGQSDQAMASYRASRRYGPFEETLAISRIDFALRHWTALSREERDSLGDQVRWIWPVRSAEIRALAHRSPIHAGFLHASLPGVTRWRPFDRRPQGERISPDGRVGQL